MTEHGSDRHGNGRFAAGNPGGPGRPTRRIELEYLATLSDSVTLADWSEIVTRAVQDAREGDAAARNWLSKHLLGDRGNLLALAGREATEGWSIESEIEGES